MPEGTGFPGQIQARNPSSKAPVDLFGDVTAGALYTGLWVWNVSGGVWEKMTQPKTTDNAELYGWNGTNFQPIGIDLTTRVLETISYPHHETHGGSNYDVTETVDLVQDNTRDIQITTPAGAKLGHFVLDWWTAAETEWWFWENVTIAQAGATITPRNHRRDAADDSIMTVKYIDNTTLTNANIDTETGSATLLSHGITGAGKKIGGTSETREEWILAPSEDYLIRWDATAAGLVSYHIDWYEHTDKAA